MDPNVTLENILEALGGREQTETTSDFLAEQLRALADWIENGGYYPEVA